MGVLSETEGVDIKMNKILKRLCVVSMVTILIMSLNGCSNRTNEEVIFNKYWSMDTKEYKGRFSGDENYIEQNVKDITMIYCEIMR